MQRLIRFENQYLLEQKTPNEIAKADARLGKVWTEIVGTSVNRHYGRAIAFHQQAQQQDWARAWALVNAPVLALYGEYDWFEVRESVELISRIVNSAHPGTSGISRDCKDGSPFQTLLESRGCIPRRKGECELGSRS